MKPKKLVKSCELQALDGVKEISFGKSSAEHRMRTGDYSKHPKDAVTKAYADVEAKNARYGLTVIGDGFGFGNL